MEFLQPSMAAHQENHPLNMVDHLSVELLGAPVEDLLLVEPPEDPMVDQLVVLVTVMEYHLPLLLPEMVVILDTVLQGQMDSDQAQPSVLSTRPMQDMGPLLEQ